MLKHLNSIFKVIHISLGMVCNLKSGIQVFFYMKSELNRQYKEFKKPKVKPKFTIVAKGIDDFKRQLEILKVEKYYKSQFFRSTSVPLLSMGSREGLMAGTERLGLAKIK